MSEAGPANKRKDSELNAPKAITPQDLVQKYASAVLGLCIAHTRNFHDSEDIMQEVFTKAISKLDTLRDPGRARAWLMQITRRMCIDYHRSRPGTISLSEEIPAPVSKKDKQIKLLYKAISQLQKEYREPITLYYLNGRNCSSVARSLGISEDAVRKRLVRARFRLHELLSEI